MFLLDDYIVCYVAKGRRVSIARVLHGKRRERRAHREEWRFRGLGGRGVWERTEAFAEAKRQATASRRPWFERGEMRSNRCVDNRSLGLLGLAERLFASRSISG